MQLARLRNSAWAFAAGRPLDRMHPRLKRTCTPAGHSFGAVADRRESGGGPLGGRWRVVSLKIKRCV